MDFTVSLIDYLIDIFIEWGNENIIQIERDIKKSDNKGEITREINLVTKKYGKICVKMGYSREEVVINGFKWMPGQIYLTVIVTRKQGGKELLDKLPKETIYLREDKDYVWKSYLLFGEGNIPTATSEIKQIEQEIKRIFDELKKL
jgi:hypothetical protein